MFCINYLSGQKQNINGRIIVEFGDNAVSITGGNRSIETKIRNSWQMFLEKIVLYDIQHRFQLAKDQSAMLVHNIFVDANSTIDQELPKKLQVKI